MAVRHSLNPAGHGLNAGGRRLAGFGLMTTNPAVAHPGMALHCAGIPGGNWLYFTRRSCTPRAYSFCTIAMTILKPGTSASCVLARILS